MVLPLLLHFKIFTYWVVSGHSCNRQASLVVVCRLHSTRAQSLASGLSYPVACEILDQGPNLCSLHWKSDSFFFSLSKLTCIYIKERQVTQFFPSSYPVDYQGNPTIPFKNLHFATLVGTYLITEEDPLFFFCQFVFLLLRKET